MGMLLVEVADRVTKPLILVKDKVEMVAVEMLYTQVTDKTEKLILAEALALVVETREMEETEQLIQLQDLL